LDHKWEQNSGIDVDSYGFNRNSQAQNYSTTFYLLHLLVRTVACGGNLLIDIGPACDGTVPVVMQDRLLELGNWLRVNGEAIYKTRIWSVQSEADNMTFYTQNEDLGAVYAITFEWPDDNTLTLSYPVPSNGTVITLLGYNGDPLKWTFSKAGLRILLPTLTVAQVPSQLAWTVRMTNLQTFPKTVGLTNYWSLSHQDHAPCTGKPNECAHTRDQEHIEASSNYRRARIEAVVFAEDQQDGSTVPLMLLHSRKRDDYAAAAVILEGANKKPSSPSLTLDDSYKSVQVLGHLYRSPRRGTIPVELWWNADRGDHFLVASEASRLEAIEAKYTLVGVQGYAFPGPYYRGSRVQQRRCEKLGCTPHVAVVDA